MQDVWSDIKERLARHSGVIVVEARELRTAHAVLRGEDLSLERRINDQIGREIEVELEQAGIHYLNPIRGRTRAIVLARHGTAAGRIAEYAAGGAQAPRTAETQAERAAELLRILNQLPDVNRAVDILRRLHSEMGEVLRDVDPQNNVTQLVRQRQAVD